MNDEQRRQEWIAQRKAEEAKRRERAAECLKAWRCKAPRATCYAFDILITRFGIAVVGDIDGLTFRVGLSYGIEFLAGDDIGYYIHSKLEEHCREREFDEEAFRAALVTGARSAKTPMTTISTLRCLSGCVMTAVRVRLASGMSCVTWSRKNLPPSSMERMATSSGAR